MCPPPQVASFEEKPRFFLEATTVATGMSDRSFL
jgi:hypothetical protein